jgi:ankyrin repeat protein
MTEEAEIHSFQTQDKLEDLYFEFLENFQSQKKKAKADEKNSKERQTKNFRAELRRFLAIQHFSINFCGRDISQSPLWQAWKQTSDLKFFKEVLERDKTEVRLADENGTTIIHLAVQQSELEIVYLLEELGLLVQMKDNDGHTPLLMAIKSSDACMVSILVYKEHPELNPKDITECTPLHLAVMSYKPSDLNSLSDLDSWRLGHINRTWNERENIIGCLLEHGANPNLMNKEGKTPLLLAFDLKDEKTVDQLLSSKLIPVEVDLYQRGRTALSLATECGMENIMKKLIPKADIEKEDDDNSRRTPLAWAIHTDNYSAASILLREGKKAKLDHRNPQGRTPFSLAAGFMQVGIMTLLLREGAEPHAEDGAGKTGFWWFLNARWKSRARGLPRHSKSQASGLADLVDLLDKPDLKDSTGRTWLSWAAEYGDEEVVRYFLQKQDSTLLDGQNQKEPNVCARTPAIWAAANDHWEVYSLLINETEHDLSLNYFIENFHRFEKELGTKALGMVQKMITHSSSSTNYCITERKSREKRTPLHIACIEAHDEIVEILIWAGALSNVLDRTGKTALQHALIKKHKKIVTRLLRSMSDLQYVRSVDWLELEDTRPCWVRINKRAKDDGFKHKPIFEPQWDWSLPKNKRKALLVQY